MDETRARFIAFESEMVERMENVGRRASDLLAAARGLRGSTIPAHMKDRALSYVGECHELGCPPPLELIQALSVVFEQSGDRRAAVPQKGRGGIAGDDPGQLQGKFQRSVIASVKALKGPSLVKFQQAIGAERALRGNSLEYASDAVSAVAKAAGVTRDTIRRWRGRDDYRSAVMAFDIQ